MKVRLKKLQNGEWQSGIYRGNGGISSLIVSRIGSFWHCFKIFINPKNYWKAWVL